MNVIRQNTDYALRVMVNLAMEYGSEPVSARKLAAANDISYQFACKIMQTLHEAKLVTSTMGPKGGFSLAQAPEKITLMDVIEAVQGPISLNQCLLSFDVCPMKPSCRITDKLADLQAYIYDYLADITLKDLLESRCSGKCAKKKRA